MSSKSSHVFLLLGPLKVGGSLNFRKNQLKSTIVFRKNPEKVLLKSKCLIKILYKKLNGLVIQSNDTNLTRLFSLKLLETYKDDEKSW